MQLHEAIHTRSNAGPADVGTQGSVVINSSDLRVTSRRDKVFGYRILAIQYCIASKEMAAAFPAHL